jgi:hypothetical protein
MITRGAGIVGYSVQTAVDAKHHLIVEPEVTNTGSDRDQLSGMAKKARAAIGTTTLTAIADRGYFKGEEILACHEAGISTLVPKTKTSGAKAEGRFDKDDFLYDPQKNEYRCPAGQCVDLEYGLCQIDANCRNLHDDAPLGSSDCSILPIWHIDAATGGRVHPIALSESFFLPDEKQDGRPSYRTVTILSL